MDHTLEKILARVQKPGRYVGGEYNAVMKNKDEVDCRFAFCFPDTYEIGMSNLGLRILYGVSNEMVFGVSVSLPPGAIWRQRCAGKGCHSTLWKAATP